MSDDLHTLLLAQFRWTNRFAAMDGWYRHTRIMQLLGPALAALHPDSRPTVIMGIESQGFLLAGLVAIHLGVGVVEVTKGRRIDEMASDFRTRTTPPDYRDRSLPLSVPRSVLTDRDHVLLVDDWIETGSQATAAAQLVEDAGATWVGVATIVDESEWSVRRRLNVKSLLRAHELSDWRGT